MSARQTAALMALQAVLADLFRADEALMQLVAGRLHDGPPRAAVLPHLFFGPARSTDFSGGDSVGARLVITIEAVDGDHERARALSILDRAAALATTSPLSPSTGSLVMLRLTASRVERLGEGRGWRAVGTLEALVDG